MSCLPARLLLALAISAAGLAHAFAQDAFAQDALAQTPQRRHTEKADVLVDTVAEGLDHPWSIAFLPDGRMLVTERPGRLRIVMPDGRRSQPLTGMPRIVPGGEGGLLDVALDPDFADNQILYLSFAEDRGDGRSGTSVARARLSDGETGLEGLRVIFRQDPPLAGHNHLGSRLVFDRTGALFVTLGDRDLRDEAQNPASTLGKIVRVAPEGGAAPGNPFLDQPGTRPEIWSIGHFNVQGAAINPATGELWTAEHGPRGGDEINIPRAGRNYGWPVITYGVDYSGVRIGSGPAKPGMEQPIYFWDPSIAPSGMSFYSGDKFPAWRGSLLVGGLAGTLVARLEISGDRVVHEERMLQALGERIRDIRQGPDGFIYLATDSPHGRILRLRPADGRS